jgi:hypothetical protein
MHYSPGVQSDDKVIQSVERFVGKRVILTEKMDGENTTLYSDYLHARSLDSRHHPSRDWVKRFQSEIGHNIPDNWRICGENLFAKHSVSYDNLDSYLFDLFDVLGNDLPDESLNPLLSLIYQFALRISDKLKNLGGYIKDENETNGFFPYLVKNIKNGIVLYQKISINEIKEFYTIYIPSN